jgi:hypothetical protein
MASARLPGASGRLVSAKALQPTVDGAARPPPAHRRRLRQLGARHCWGSGTRVIQASDLAAIAGGPRASRGGVYGFEAKAACAGSPPSAGLRSFALLAAATGAARVRARTGGDGSIEPCAGGGVGHQATAARMDAVSA